MPGRPSGEKVVIVKKNQNGKRLSRSVKTFQVFQRFTEAVFI